MFELALHILDIVQNSIAAQAKRVVIAIDIDETTGIVTLRITDDGFGMDEATQARVMSPFGTSRTTRKVGLGIPMLAECAGGTGGTLQLQSVLGCGTVLTATFGLHHIDRPPMGDLAETFASLTLCNPELDFALELSKTGHEDEHIDTRELRDALGDVPLNTPDVVAWIRESVSEASAPWLV